MNDKIKRNDPCPCGSGKKYKKCCGQKKSMSNRKTSVIDSSASNSLLDRISKGGAMHKASDSNEYGLKNRITKNINE